jgi:hypothetical protein
MAKHAPATPTELQAFLEALADGKRAKELHADPLMPTRYQVRLAAKQDEKFADMLLEARISGLEAMADELLDIADDGSNDWMERETRAGIVIQLNSEAVQRSKLRLEARQWLLERLRRELYGKSEHVTGDVNHYVVELPAPVKDTQEWMQQHSQANQPEIASLSGALNQAHKPH